MLNALLTPLLCLTLGWSSGPEPHTAPPAEPPTIEVGSKALRKAKLVAFDSTWRTKRGALITEVATLETLDKRKCYVHRQVWPLQPGLELHSKLVLDRKTLETISFEKQVVGLPEGASMGARADYLRWDFDGAAYTHTARHGAEEQVTQGELASPMFSGSGLGLVIAALPLKDGYTARLPIAMSLGHTSELTLYMVTIRVNGKEPLMAGDKQLAESWVVEVDWADPETGEVTSVGGVSSPGGAYFVLPRPPRGLPHVPAYHSDGSSIELVVEG